MKINMKMKHMIIQKEETQILKIKVKKMKRMKSKKKMMEFKDKLTMDLLI
jgi:hypothetical protein